MWKRISSSRASRDMEIHREHSIHLLKLSRVSSRIDNKSPQERIHVKKNLKGKLLAKGRKEYIVSTNRLLVDKLLRVNSRDSSTGRSTRIVNKSEGKKKYELTRITLENVRILHKIKTSKPHYSTERQRQEYQYSSTLKNMISKNAGRVPKVLNYTHFDFNPALDFNKSARSLNKSTRFDAFI